MVEAIQNEFYLFGGMDGKAVLGRFQFAQTGDKFNAPCTIFGAGGVVIMDT
jgi:hypothetical protein